MKSKFENLIDKLEEFRELREWKQFHDPKNLAEAITIEASELMELFLWKKNVTSKDVTKEELQNIKEEVADILNFLIYLCQELNIDLIAASIKKIEQNGKKYPISKALGNSTKYDRL